MYFPELLYFQIPKTHVRQKNPIIIKGFAVLFPFLFMFFGCSTTSDNIVATSEETQIRERCNEIDLLLLDYKFKQEKSLLDGAEKLIKEQLSKKIVDKNLAAELYGLTGILDWEKGDKESVRKDISVIENLSKKEERLYILRAGIEAIEAKQIEILETGLAQCTQKARITLELAERYNARGDYAKASASYDEAFVSLDKKYEEYYKKNRDAAYQFMSNPEDFGSAKSILTKDALSVSDLLLGTLAGTHFLANITTNKASSGQALFDLCIKNGYLYSAVSGPQAPLARKDAAFFFLSIVIYQENNKSLAAKYSSDYSRTNKTSPVPDVKVTDYYFDAVLVLVEREILDLPDGINFFPDTVLSGPELNDVLKKLLKLYNY